MDHGPVDLAFREIGEWGPFSRRVYGLFGCVWAVCGMEALVTMFSSHYPGRWGCDGKGLAPPTLARLSSLGVHCADGTHAMAWYPMRALAPSGDICAALPPSALTFSLPPGASLLSDWRLVCTHAGAESDMNTLYFLGYLLGSVGVGWVCDAGGRRLALRLSAAVTAAATVLYVCAPTLPVLMAARLAVGVGTSGLVLSSYLFATEFVGGSVQGTAGALFSCFFTAGLLLMSPIAAWVPDWRALACVPPVCLCVLLPLLCRVPESPRWLHAQGRVREGNAVMRAVAAGNGVLCYDPPSPLPAPLPLPAHTLPPLTLTKAPLLPSTAWWCLLLPTGFLWFTAYIAYYSLALSATLLSGSIFANNAWCAVAEFPAYVCVAVVLGQWGRRMCLRLALTITTLACFAAAWCQLVELRSSSLCTEAAPHSDACSSSRLASLAALASVVTAKLGAAAATAILYVYALDLFPVAVASSALGVLSMCGCVGGLVCPSLLHHTSGAAGLTMSALGVTALAGGLVTAALPKSER